METPVTPEPTNPVPGEDQEIQNPTGEAGPSPEEGVLPTEGESEERKDEPTPESPTGAKASGASSASEEAPTKEEPTPELSPAPAGEEEEATAEINPMEALLEESFELKRFRRGQIVEGLIVAIQDGEIIVDIGGKSEGIVPAHDLAQLDEEFVSSLNVGDTIVAYVLRPEGRDGHAILSLARAQVARDWRRVEELARNGEIIEAPVIEVNRGGVIVRVGQLRGFVPASQLVRRNEAQGAEDSEDRFRFLQGQTLKLKVLDVDRRRKRLILSERQAMKEIQEQEKQRLLEELREGEVRHGRVTSITNFGAFVDIGGIDGLVHISELAWHHVKHPSEVLQVGDEVDVYVLSVDRQRGRVGLSIRRLLPKPWETVLERYAVGQVVTGTVTKVVPFGAFVRLEDGIEGLIHISELADRRVEHPREIVKEGDEVQVRILRIDPQAKRIGLSLKQAAEDAYVEIDWDVAEEDEVETGTWTALEAVQTNGTTEPIEEPTKEEGETPSSPEESSTSG